MGTMNKYSSDDGKTDRDGILSIDPIKVFEIANRILRRMVGKWCFI